MPAVVVAGQGRGNVETPHPAKLLLLLEEEELVGLHQKLTSDLVVVVDYDVVDPVLVQYLAGCKPGRSGTDNGDCACGRSGRIVVVHSFALGCALWGSQPPPLPHRLRVMQIRLICSIDQHLTGATFANAALEAPLSVVSGCDCVQEIPPDAVPPQW
jgi:hypothetical protein